MPKRAALTLQSEPERRDGEERKKSDDVGDGRHERAGRNGGIGTQTFKRHRDQDAAERTGDEIADHRKTDDNAQGREV